jgi:hypothetical protein
MYQNLPSQEPPKFTQIGMFGLKINHLATLVQTLGPFQVSAMKRFKLQELLDDRNNNLCTFSASFWHFVAVIMIANHYYYIAIKLQKFALQFLLIL